MYEVAIINGSEETIIHYPTPDSSAPHIKELQLQEALSSIYTLKFPIYQNNPGYDKIFELTTKVKVIDLRDNSIRFIGRISDIEENMDDMSLYKEVTCESALTYLNDTKMRNEVLTGGLSTMLQTILNKHNSKVDSGKQIQLGKIEVSSNEAYQCEFKSSLETILDMKSKNNIHGDIRIREANRVLYLDWLLSFTAKVIPLQLGQNIQKMILSKNMDDFGTRIIPLGANNLTIADANAGVDYIEDAAAVSSYGVIEKTVSYSDITDAATLYNKCLEDLKDYTQPQLTLKSTANDLSFLTDNKAEKFELGATLYIKNSLMNIDANYKIVQISLDLLQPYNPDIIISNSPVTFAAMINSIRSSSISNNGVYNNVQVGSNFGIRVVRSDGTVVLLLNATEGISIQNNSKKVFYVNENGNIEGNDCTFNDVTANRGTYNNIVANEMKTSNTTNYIVLHDQYMEFYHAGNKRMSIGFEPLNNIPSVKFYSEDGQYQTIGITAANYIMMDDISVEGSLSFNRNAETGTNLATKAWVQSYVAAHQSIPLQP